MKKYSAKSLTSVLLLIFSASSAALAQTTYWLPTVERTPTAVTYRYDVKAPDYFGEWIVKKTPLGGGASVSKTINGKNYTFVRQIFSWDTNSSSPAKTGQICIDNKLGGFGYGDWMNSAKLKGEADVIRALDSGTNPPSNAWRRINLLALKWDGDTPPGLTFNEEVSKLDQLKARRKALAENTRPGKFYPNVKVPADLEGYRQVMLDIVNLGRLDLDYRKGKKMAPDLRAEYGKTNLGMEKIHHDNPTAPRFNDLAMDDRLNDAAQLQAEWAAQQLYMGHDGPTNYKGKNLKGLGARKDHFAPKYMSIVEAGGWLDYPEGWMKGETHYRPWFNIQLHTSFVGFGAAIGSDNKVRSFGVAVESRPHIAGAQSASLTFRLPLGPGKELEREKKYFSEDGRTYLMWQKDGNVAVRFPTDGFKGKRTDDGWVWTLWESSHKVAGYQIASLRVSAAGQLEAVDKDGKALWTAPNTMPTLGADGISQEPVVVVGGGGAVVAQPSATTPAAGPPSVAEILASAPIIWEGSWDWDKDDAFAANHLTMGVLGDAGNGKTKFGYTSAGKAANILGKIGKHPGNKLGPAIVNLDLPNGDHLRFVWKSLDLVEAEFWPKGKKAGAQKNNPPHTTSKLKRVR